MIIETSSGQIFRVQDNAATPHAWLGVELNRRTLEPKPKARTVLVRKEQTTVIAR